MSDLDAILAAAKGGDVNTVSALLDGDPSLATAANMFGSKPIHAAYFSGRHEVVDLLLSRGVSIDTGLAAELGLLDRVHAAVEADPGCATAFGPQGSTLLHRACYWGQLAVSEFLLDSGADPSAPTRDNFLQIPPLGCAVATPDVPNPSDDEQIVLELVRLLLARGANVNGRRRDGLTALHSAAYRGHLLVISCLLGHGADPSIRGSQGPHDGQTAKDMALSQGQTEAAALLDQYTTA
ncbi:MAG: hypothetical protein C5B51_22365 [Terriglobia bacterium]|nr:MAG: hypothetical protein C5B51_22365 [Terriglobia bacterium]